MQMGWWAALALMQTSALPATQAGSRVTPDTDLFADGEKADLLSKERPPEPDGYQSDWFPNDAYPPEARRRSEQGRVGLALDVDATGKPTSCTIVLSSGFATLDGATCDLAMANARFKPALDRQGRPVAGRVALRNVVWMLDSPGTDVDAGAVTMAMPKTVTMIDVEGRITGCHVVLADGSRGESCPASMIGRKQSLLARRGGVPVPGMLTQSGTVTIEAIDQSRP